MTGVDFVEAALDKARVKTRAAGVNVRYVRADATSLGSYGVGSGFDLVADPCHAGDRQTRMAVARIPQSDRLVAG